MRKIEAKRSEFGLKLRLPVGTYRLITAEVGASSKTCATRQPVSGRKLLGTHA